MIDHSQCRVSPTDYETDNLHTWCTSCGNYGINGALRRALSEKEIEPKDVVLVFDIGCNGNGSDKIDGYTVHGLHGRAIPFAVGASQANRNIPVIASGGDGATIGEGINHLIHAVRSNYNIVFLLHNNSNYGLTTGQASPTTNFGKSMNSNPSGVIAPPINISQLILSISPTFFARGYSGNIQQLTQIIKEGIDHKGFSFIEILQDCPTYNKDTPHDWYMQRVYDINQLKKYDKSNVKLAREISADLEDRIATGIIYQDQNSVCFYDKVESRKDVHTELVGEVRNYNISSLMQSFK
jgi:2-oxoglutarate ferredoxin oxidoreductase subunit beta